MSIVGNTFQAQNKWEIHSRCEDNDRYVFVKWTPLTSLDKCICKDLPLQKQHVVSSIKHSEIPHNSVDDMLSRIAERVMTFMANNHIYIP